MQTFEQTLDPDTWTEILQGAPSIAFDLSNAKANAEVYLTETDANPGSSATGNKVASWPQTWDFQAVGMEQPGQYLWVRGNGSITGVR